MKCTCEPTERLLFACSGGSNVGQISNEAAKSLEREGHGRMFCLAGTGGHVDDIIESTKAAKRTIAIDGCTIACVKKTLEHAGFEVDDYVIVSDLGVEKRRDFNIADADIIRVRDEVLKSLSGGQLSSV